MRIGPQLMVCSLILSTGFVFATEDPSSKETSDAEGSKIELERKKPADKVSSPGNDSTRPEGDPKADSVTDYEDGSLYAKTFVELYDLGVDAYLQNSWRDCILYLETAVHEFTIWRQTVVNCRIECWFDNEQRETLYKPARSNLENLPFFDLVVQRALCLGRCHNKWLRKQYLPPFHLSRKYRDRFHRMAPYEYLQLCLYKDEEYEKAASATYTVLMADPGNELMISNMNYYLHQLNVTVSAIRDLEEKRYVKTFVDAQAAYDREDYGAAVGLFEESLTQFVQAEDECRAYCDGEFDHGGWQPDFITAIGNHYTFNLYCRLNCTNELSRIRATVYPNVVSTHFEFLQLSYYKVGDVEAACRALGSSLLFQPDNQELLFNVDFYKQAHQVPDTAFAPRIDARNYFDRQKYEKTILYNFLESYDEIHKEESRRKRPQRKFVEGGLRAQFAINGTDVFGNEACIIESAINLFKHSVLEIK